MDMREKLIELLTEYFGVDPAYYGIEAQHLADHLIANGVTIQKWIPVTERLPANWCPVLVVLRGAKISLLGSYRGDAWFWEKFSTTFNREVTHWMPLPEPPKEVTP